mgnify:CR=1 FL=1
MGTTIGASRGVERHVLDVRGLAQVLELFDRDDADPPSFVYHELALTDGAGHEFGPHSQGLCDALDETDRRIGHVLALFDRKGWFDDTLGEGPGLLNGAGSAVSCGNGDGQALGYGEKGAPVDDDTDNIGGVFHG